MARLYTDEDFSRQAAEALRQLGHDVLTVQESGRAGQRIPDSDVLAYATTNKRIVVTHNGKDFIRLHKSTSHAGIIICTTDSDTAALAARISAILEQDENQNTENRLMRVVKPPSKSEWFIPKTALFAIDYVAPS